MFCGKTAEFQIEDETGDIAQGIWDWEHGKGYVQDIPGLNPAMREILMTGSHDECFNQAFPEEANE
jgi:hypothetical protein